MQETPFKCQKAQLDVVMYSQPFRFSGIGEDGVHIQREYQCSAEATCPFRYDPACRVKLLEGQP